MKNKNFVKEFCAYSIISLLTATVIWNLSCSKDSNNATGGPGPGGGGPTREFVSGNLSGSGGSFSHVFDSAKVIPYYCRHHGAAGGVGMSGVITVTAGGTPSRIDVEILTSTLPDLNIDVLDTVVWTNNSGILHTVESDN